MTPRTVQFLVGALLMSSCTVVPAVTEPGSPPMLSLSAPVSASAKGAVGGTLIMNFQPAIELGYLSPTSSPGFHTLAQVHRWEASDIYQYRTTLKVQKGSSFVDLNPPMVLLVPQKGPTATNQAAFTNLAPGQRYQVSAIAEGNVGGTAATTLLSQIPAVVVAEFGKSAKQTSVNLQVSLTRVPFSGRGEVTLEPPDDGTITQPSAPVAGTAQ